MERSLSLARGREHGTLTSVVDEPIRQVTTTATNFYAAPLEKAVNDQIPEREKMWSFPIVLWCGSCTEPIWAFSNNASSKNVTEKVLCVVDISSSRLLIQRDM
jgi:hypothetical protein